MHHFSQPYCFLIHKWRMAQGTSLLSGAGLSLLLTRKLGARPWMLLAPQCAGVCLFTAELWALLL